MAVLQWLAHYFLSFARLPDKAIQYLRLCEKVEPNSPTWGMLIARCYHYMHDLEAALDEARRVYKMNPQYDKG